MDQQQYLFDRETALAAAGENRFTLDLSSAWNIGDNPNGGYMLAPLLQAMSRISGQPHPMSVTTHFLRPGTGGAPAEIEVEPVRVGRTVGTVRGRLVQSGKTRVESLAAFSDVTPVDGVVDLGIEPVDLPPPEACVHRSNLEQGVDLPILDRLDVRVHPDHAVAGEGARAEIAGWIRFADERPVDPFALTLFADAFPPPLFALVGYIGWVPTIELTVHVRRVPVDGWIRAHFQVNDANGVRFVEDGTLWDSSGAVVARSRQVGMILSDGTS